jgi:hypothetical protein
MGLKVTNNAFGTLNAGINDSATTIVLTAGQGSRFPTLSAGDYFYATLIDTSNNLEIVKVTARSTDTVTVVRAQDNTTARAYSTNDRFELRPTAALFNEITTIAESAAAAAAAKVSKSGDTMTGPLVSQVSSGTAAETTVLALQDSSGNKLGKVTSYNGGAYNQDMRFYTTNASGDNERLAMTLLGASGNLKPAKGLAPVYESAWVSMVQGGNYFFSHGLGRQPYLVRVYAKWDNTDDNKPWLCVGDLGVWDDPTGGGSDRGMVAGVSNSLICVAVGEGGVSTDWGVSQNGFPMNNNAMETFLAANGQNSGADFMDTPTEAAGIWGTPWVKVYAW